MTTPRLRESPALKMAAATLVVLAMVVAQRLGVFHALADAKSIARQLVDLGAWGYAAFVLSYAIFQPFGVPGTAFIVAAPLIWPWPVAFAVSMAGTMAASSLGFAFARWIARDWVSARIPERFRRYDDALAARAFVTVFFLRLVFWMPPLLHAFFGVSKVRFWTHFWASFLGYLPPVFLVSFFGQRLFDAVTHVPLSRWAEWTAALLLVVVVGLAVRRYARPRRDGSGGADV
jgi:uncharacterized membrane protein YdjX (TVP38/TMEM64 family)